jgi:hypothetical protein
MRVLQAVAFLALLAVAAFAQSQQTGFQTVIQDLASFQSKSGGFSALVGEQPTLEATADALFIASIYGLLDKIDAAAASKFVDTLKTADGVTAPKAGLPATTSSVRDALLINGHTGVSVDKTSVEKFLRSLFDSEASLFAPRSGGIANAKATAEALEVMSLAGLSSRDWAVKAIESVKVRLTSAIKEDGAARFFDFGVEQSFESNVYALVAAQYAGVSLPQPRSFVQYFLDRQHQRVGGIASQPGAVPTVESTHQGILALTAIERASGFAALESISGESMMQTLYPVPHDLHKAGLAHFAFAHLPNFKDVFQHEVMFDTPSSAVIDSKNPVIVQGTPVTLFVVAFPWNQPHAGLNVEAVVSHASGADKKYKLHYNAERFGYTTEEAFETQGKLGALSVTVNIGIQTPGEALGFQAQRKFNIGYTISAKASAKLAGRDVAPGEQVSMGTEFSFTITLADNTGTISSGPFDLVMDVLDSSGVIVAQTVRNFAKGETGAFNFELSQAALPAGVLAFNFHVRDHATNTIHSQYTVAYDLDIKMVASQIKIGDGSSVLPSFKLGDEAVVTFVPASFPHMVNLHPYAATDATGADVSQKRAFFLDTLENGQVLRSFVGVAKNVAGNVQVSFTVTFPAVFDAIGTHEIRFRYAPAEGREIALGNYDSSASELFDETVKLGFEVKADLSIVDLVDVPKGGSLNYGDPIKFSFKIKDSITGEHVSSYGGASVFLALAHKDANGKTYVSARHPVNIDPRGGFEADWTVNPNAISGKGVLQLQASILGGAEVSLPTEDGKPFAVSVQIGGEISHTATVKQVSLPTASHGAAVVQFELQCQKRVLTGALLTAAIHKNGKLVATAPVARSDDESVYTVSWALSEAEASSGAYSIAIHRQADQANAAPLFTIPVAFVGAITHYLPFRTEALVLTLAFVSFGIFSYRKYLIERK